MKINNETQIPAHYATKLQGKISDFLKKNTNTYNVAKTKFVLMISKKNQSYNTCIYKIVVFLDILRVSSFVFIVYGDEFIKNIRVIDISVMLEILVNLGTYKYMITKQKKQKISVDETDAISKIWL